MTCEDCARHRRYCVVCVSNVLGLQFRRQCHITGKAKSCWMDVDVTALTGLVPYMLCRFQVNCGKILAMKQWQALTGMVRNGGGGVFQVSLLREVVITDS